jgi:hypothetical protein
MAKPQQPDATIEADDFIQEADRDATPANDDGRVPVLEPDGFLSQEWYGLFDYTRLGINFNRFSAVSNQVQHTNPAGTTSNQTASISYDKIAEIELNEDMDLTRVTWTMTRINTGSGSSNFKNSAVFVNGVQVSSDLSGENGTYSYDITSALSSGDLIQIYAKKDSTTEDFLRVSNQTLSYDSQIEAIGGITMDTPLLSSDPSPVDATNNL